MDVLEALKNEGNALFQQQRFGDAVKAYNSVLEKLQNSVANDEEAARLEMAVRLNRAWAFIQMSPSESNESTLLSAEQDCSEVIKMDPSCVKAFYRRALARERRGQWKTAMDDAVNMRRIEPGHPSVGPLLERLQQHTLGNEDLESKFQQCSISSDSTDISDTVPLARKAEGAWKALQAVEITLQKSTAKARHKPVRTQNDKRATRSVLEGEISEKTDELWESLRQEEITTLEKAFPRSKKDTRPAR
ncbi:Mitochondrial import receptor subunit TOM34 [Phytophthora citrophthora]|uniref:Mitochondrial import receptor subunit TOM34 n=1 Tax=Phytophthora citrophthora TaxID=4793 RepID=A0AAD9LPR8_9STRA|nr:Mitochondrial import receptor subunit TOM34 [Phytophthora citrophthora]